MLPLLLGILAANQYFQDRRDDETAAQYRGLLGTAPQPMGPPTEEGAMGYSGGTGLLADPNNIQNQLQFAAGVAGLRNQQGVGTNLLNSAFSRAQQEHENQLQRAQQASQFAQQFQAGRDDAAAAGDRWGQEFRFRQSEAERAAQQYQQTFGAGRDDAAWGRFNDNRRFGLLANQDERERAAAAAKPAPGAELPKLQAGYVYQPSPDGTRMIAAPIEGTPDYAKAKAAEEGLAGADSRIEEMLSMLQGVEQVTPQGNKVRVGGVGSEWGGQNAERYSGLRGAIIADLGKMREAGVIDKNEWERMAEQLADPTALTSYVRSNATMGAGYEQLRTQIKRKLKEHRKANPWLVPKLPPGFQGEW